MYSQIQVQDMYIWECWDNKQMQGNMPVNECMEGNN